MHTQFATRDVSVTLAQPTQARCGSTNRRLVYNTTEYEKMREKNGEKKNERKNIPAFSDVCDSGIFILFIILGGT